jgi:predicted nuclease with TOPRIM domain
MSETNLNAVFRQLGEVIGTLDALEKNLDRVGDEVSTIRQGQSLVSNQVSTIDGKVTHLTIRMDAVEKPARNWELTRSHWTGVMAALAALAGAAATIVAGGHSHEWLPHF